MWGEGRGSKNRGACIWPRKLSSVEEAIVVEARFAPDMMAAASIELLEKVVASAFSQRRKTLRNTLGGMLSAAEFEQIGIDPGRRAETLAVEDFVCIANYLHGKEAQ